jgi:hypothetical protein
MKPKEIQSRYTNDEVTKFERKDDVKLDINKRFEVLHQKMIEVNEVLRKVNSINLDFNGT